MSSTDMLNPMPRGFLKYCLETFFLVPTSPWAQLYVFSFQMPILWPSATRVPTCARQLHPRQLKSPISSYSFFNFTYSTPTYTIIAVIMNSKYKILGKVKRERVEKREKTFYNLICFMVTLSCFSNKKLCISFCPDFSKLCPERFGLPCQL